MKDWIVQPPTLVRKLIPNSVWRIETQEKFVCLTFDDGPVPEQTPWVLDTLDAAGIKGTFFMVGENIQRHADIYLDLLRRGHEAESHTQSHTKLADRLTGGYMKCAYEGRKSAFGNRPRLFRPPHGQMTPLLAYRLTHSKTGLANGSPFDRVVFWDVMPRDYDNRLTGEDVLRNVKEYVRPGSIIVFHDSIKAGDRMRFALQGTIEFLKEKGYAFKTVSEAIGLN